MNNEGGKMEEDLRAGFGETEGSFEISKETMQKLGGMAVKSVDELIEKADSEIRQKVEANDPNAAYDDFRNDSEVVIREVEGNK